MSHNASAAASFDLTGRSIVVTGACGGIGRELVAAVQAAGAHVLAVDLPAATGNCHQSVEHLAADLTDLSTHAHLFTRAASLAPVGGLVHAAAMIHRLDIDDVTEESFEQQFRTNVTTTFFLDREAWRAMRARGGSIVNFSSQGWWTGGYLGSVVYAATKGSVVSLTRGLARSFAADKVRVNAVSPGFIDTPMLHEGTTDEALAVLAEEVPLQRFGRPDELAGAVLYLLSEASSYTTGTVLNISGGHLPY